MVRAHPSSAAQIGQLVPAWELRVADFARHLWLSAGERTGCSYLDVLHRLAAFGADPLEAERGDLERFLARPRRGRHADWQGRLSASTQTTELAGLRRFYAWAREEGLRTVDPTQGLRPPRREPYAGSRALSAGELARILAVIPATMSPDYA